MRNDRRVPILYLRCASAASRMKTVFVLILGCSVAVDDYYAFKEHTNTCDNARNTKSLTCVHCGRPFMKNEKFFDHMAVHSMPRYYCSLCDFKHTLSPKVKDHMKAHKVLKTKCVPADSLKDNQFRDIFFIVPDLVSYLLVFILYCSAHPCGFMRVCWTLRRTKKVAVRVKRRKAQLP